MLPVATPSNRVSILVSYWMGWECLERELALRNTSCFNPSFLLDGLGISSTSNAEALITSFNPSFLLDGLGILMAPKPIEYELLVSILVSYWMGWE